MLLKYGKAIGKCARGTADNRGTSDVLPLGEGCDEGTPANEEPQGRTAKTQGDSGASDSDCDNHRLRLQPHRRRAAEAGDQQDQSPDSAEHPQRRRHSVGPESHLRLLGQLRQTACRHAVGMRFLLGQDRMPSRPDGGKTTCNQTPLVGQHRSPVSPAS